MLNFKMWPLEDFEKKLASCFFFTHNSAKSSYTNLDQIRIRALYGRKVGWMLRQYFCCKIQVVVFECLHSAGWLSWSWSWAKGICRRSLLDDNISPVALAILYRTEWRRSILNLLALHFRFWWSVALQLQFMTQLQSSLQWQISPLLLHCTKKNILWTLCIPPRGDFHTKIICLVYFHTFLL